jgi:hypothetical protein
VQRITSSIAEPGLASNERQDKVGVPSVFVCVCEYACMYPTACEVRVHVYM